MHEDVDQQKLAVYKRCMKAHTDAIKEYLAEFIEKTPYSPSKGRKPMARKMRFGEPPRPWPPIQLARRATWRAQVVSSNQTQVEMLEIPT